jgi:hypothetical protein
LQFVSSPDLHPDLEAVRFLLGIWEGTGKGVYPTIEPFAYREEVRISHVGKPFLVYGQRTWAESDGRPLHAETGYWRFPPGGRVELVLAHPTGVVEVEEGTIEGTTLELATTSVGRTATAKDVRTLARRVSVEGYVLRYTLDMEAVAEPLQRHLDAELRRTA